MRWGAGTLRLFGVVFILWTIGLSVYGLHQQEQRSTFALEYAVQQCVNSGELGPNYESCIHKWKSIFPKFSPSDWFSAGGYWIWLLGPVVITAGLLLLFAMAVFVWRGFAPRPPS